MIIFNNTTMKITKEQIISAITAAGFGLLTSIILPELAIIKPIVIALMGNIGAWISKLITSKFIATVEADVVSAEKIVSDVVNTVSKDANVAANTVSKDVTVAVNTVEKAVKKI